MTPVTAHFSREEFGQREGHGVIASPYPAAWVETRLVPLCQQLEVLRARLGARPITVLSGYRSPAYNAALLRLGHRVSPRSQHCEGRAADIQVDGLSPEQVHRCALQLYSTGAIQLGGLGIYSSFVHLDTRPGPLRQWDER